MEDTPPQDLSPEHSMFFFSSPLASWVRISGLRLRRSDRKRTGRDQVSSSLDP